MSIIDRGLLFSAIPHPDESFIGYLLRLTEVNRYKTLSWILQLAAIKDYAHSGFSFALKDSLNLSPLAQLTGINESALALMLYVPLRISKERMMGDYSVFGSAVPHYIIQLRKPKICPKCLLESNYVRKIWELAPVTACPLHQCLLLDECPSCGTHITWNRAGISRCRCKFDWRNHKTDLVDDLELVVTRQIHLLCNLPVGSDTSGELRGNIPLYKLGLGHFISALIFIASQLVEVPQRKGSHIIGTKGRNFAPSRRNAEIHDLLCKALPVFDDWPNNYYSFLDRRRAQKSVSKGGHARADHFSGYKSALFGQLGSADFKFMREAFREYRRIWRYKSYAVTSGNTINREDETPSSAKSAGISIPEQTDVEISKLYETHVLGIKAVRALKTTWRGLEGLIVSGRLKAIIVRKGEDRLVLIEKVSLYELKEKLERSLLLKQVKPILGVHLERIKELIECGLLTLLRGPKLDGYGHWIFDRKEVADLVERLVSRLPRKRRADEHQALNLNLVLRKIGCANIGLGAFLQAVLDGEIKSCGRGQEVGLQGLLFQEKQITDYVKSELQLLIGDVLSLSEVSTLLGVTKSAVSFLMRKELLHAEKFANAPSLGRLVKREEFDSFNEKYLLAREIASKYDTTPRYIVDLLNKRGVQPVSGSKVDGGCIYLIKKSEIEALDLAAIISEEKKKQAIRSRLLPQEANLDSKDSSTIGIARLNHLTLEASQWWILDERQAAEALELDVWTVRQLAERGTLKLHNRLSRDNPKNEKYYFSGYIVQKYKNRSADHSGLIAFMVAAKLLNLYPENFYNRYVKTGRLKPVLAEGRRCEHLFRLKDVEVLLEIEKQTIITPEVAKILEVNVSCIDKMMASSILKPISGPAIDGFGKNLFLRSDVEKIRAEREAFKAKRIKEGKTPRFGRGNKLRPCPVRDKVGPRIDQLIQIWGAKTQKGRFSAPRIYHQLVEEGYHVGINTVYVYLREHQRQSMVPFQQRV